MFTISNQASTLCVRSCQKRSRTANAPWPSSWSSLEVLTARFDSGSRSARGRASAAACDACLLC
eukprot:scaffold49161_cov62-Phaeocystis_antarctica.AAC.2